LSVQSTIMKKIITTLVCLCTVVQFAAAAHFDDRRITKGTVLNYTVKDGTILYKLKATITECNNNGNIKLQWQTTGAKAIKGSCTFPYASLEKATEMKMKLQPGNEILTEETSRWFVGYDVYDYMFNLGIDGDLKIDDNDETFTPDEDETEKDILYNKVKISMEYTQGTKTEAGNTTTIGLIEYADKIILLNNYSSGNFSITLVSIQSPVAKAATKLEDNVSKQILKELTPKNAVPLKKMEPAKYATVKAAYPLLATVENYDATKGGKVSKPITETYEYRYGSNSPNPPSLIDCLTADLKIIYNQKEKFNITDIEMLGNNRLTATAAKKLLDVYMTTEYVKIPGYRPWTNWSFVRSLTDSQRTQLATELQGYITKYGFSE